MKTSCVLWRGAVSNGYGKYHTHLAHRLAYVEAHGPVPVGWVVHHQCREKLCVNPDHLVAMTRTQHQKVHASEVAAYQGKFNAAKTHCPQGHAYTEDNTYLYRNMRMCKACRREVQRRPGREHLII
jgi:hypothetical protein